MAIRDRVLELLATRPDGLDDDEIARTLNLTTRQQANQICRRLQNDSLVERRGVHGKIRNFLATGAESVPSRSDVQAFDVQDGQRPWHWEGNVQAMLVPHLVSDGWTIVSAANTSTKERGKDIVASRGSDNLWVSVKGYPTGTARTSASTQARHWFSHGLFNIVLWHGEDRSALLMLALPDFPTYRKLAERATWFVRVTPFTIAWLDASGDVRWYPPFRGDQLPFDGYRQGGRALLGAPRWGDGSSRRGYGIDVFAECGYTCAYCGLDMDTTYEGWLQLSVDHVMPAHLGKKGYPAAWIEDVTNMVTCCRACNEFLNGYRVNDSSPTDLARFYELRNHHFLAKREAVSERHLREREWYLGRPMRMDDI